MEKSEALSYVFYRARRISEEYDYFDENIEHGLLAVVEMIMDWTLDKLPDYMQSEEIKKEIAEAYAMLNSHPMFGLSLSRDFLVEAFENGSVADDEYQKTCSVYTEMHRLAEEAQSDVTVSIFLTAMLKYPTELITKCVLRDPPRTKNVSSFEDWF